MPSCRSCNAPVEWAFTTNGKRIPLEPGPDADGSYEIVGTTRREGQDEAKVVRPVLKGEETLPGLAAPDRFMPHHATCPDAEDWRR